MRARRIVLMAMDIAQDAGVKEWLRMDEKGVFEQLAGSLVAETVEEVAKLGLTDSEVDRQVATAIALAAVEATLRGRES